MNSVDWIEDVRTVHAALILAGGASSRMGQDKATLRVDGVEMIVRVAHALRDAGCRPILIAVRDGYQRREIGGLLIHLTDVDYILDRGLERGSKPALRSALEACATKGIQQVQLAPCDLPWLSPELIVRLRTEKDRRVMMPRSTGLEPMLALIEVEHVLDSFEASPAKASLQDIMRRVPHRIVSTEGIDPRCFINVNRPEDLGR
jgi:molybdopterin-guanine dinucleotide biosynthesis protein A